MVHSSEWTTGSSFFCLFGGWRLLSRRASGPLDRVDHWLYQNLSFQAAGAPPFSQNTKEALPLKWQGCLLLTGLFAVFGVGDPDAGYD